MSYTRPRPPLRKQVKAKDVKVGDLLDIQTPVKRIHELMNGKRVFYIGVRGNLGLNQRWLPYALEPAAEVDVYEFQPDEVVETPHVDALKEYLKSLTTEAKDEILEYFATNEDALDELTNCVHPLSLESFGHSLRSTVQENL